MIDFVIIINGTEHAQSIVIMKHKYVIMKHKYMPMCNHNRHKHNAMFMKQYRCTVFKYDGNRSFSIAICNSDCIMYGLQRH